MSKIEFSTADKETTVFAKFMRLFDDKIAEYREQNDTAQPEHITTMLRGRIAELKELKTLNDDPPKIIKGELD